MDNYICSSERFRVIRVFFGVPESYRNSPGSTWALLGFRGKREERLGAPQGLVRIGPEGGAAPPPSFSSPFPCLDSYSWNFLLDARCVKVSPFRTDLAIDQYHGPAHLTFVQRSWLWEPSRVPRTVFSSFWNRLEGS